MLKKHMAACLMATAFVAAPALAQSTTAPATNPPAATTAPATSAPMNTTSSSSGMSGQFMAMPQPNQLRASKLIGTDIYGSNNERIGEVNEVLLDREGNVDAVVIGVGGFLGIGEKNVAMPFKTVEWKWDRDVAATAGTRPAGTAGTTTGTGTAPASGTAAGTAPATTGTAAADGFREAPERGVIKMSKADLEAAPRFNYSANRTNGTAPATNTAPPAKQ